ncbi:hypothetical protein TorRG33x02_211470 [Trema orientale]|uniref:Uncharacterized protein n=1 Tax=Trema orientale TaxID=63057 RepID=A0A2P5EBW4_TREOI|nr:hypothetical protein TorRG33x02_211470 [Trema orientale]
MCTIANLQRRFTLSITISNSKNDVSRTYIGLKCFLASIVPQQQHLRVQSQSISIGLRNLQILKSTNNYPIHIEQEEFTT